MPAIEINAIEVLALKKLALVNGALAKSLSGQAKIEQTALLRVLMDVTNRADLANSTDKSEGERVRLWNENRDLRASLDVERAATDSMRIERDKMFAALKFIASPSDCGCSPVCQCGSQESLKIELDVMHDKARATLEELRMGDAS